MSKSVELALKREELLLDIKNIAYVMARSNSEANAPTSDNKWLIDVAQELEEGGDNNEIATRFLNLCWAEINYQLSVWGIACDETEGMDDTYTQPDVYATKLQVPGEMKHAAVKLLVELMHQLMVYKVLLRWGVTIGIDTTSLESTVSGIEDRVKSLVNANSVHHRPMFPW